MADALTPAVRRVADWMYGNIASALDPDDTTMHQMWREHTEREASRMVAIATPDLYRQAAAELYHPDDPRLRNVPGIELPGSARRNHVALGRIRKHLYVRADAAEPAAAAAAIDPPDEDDDDHGGAQ